MIVASYGPGDQIYKYCQKRFKISLIVDFDNSSLLDDVLARQLFKCMIRMSGGEVFKMCKISEKFQVWLEVTNLLDLFPLEKSSLDLDALKFLVQR